MIDVQGTLIDDRHKLPIPGALEALETINRNGIPFVLVTNNTKQESENFKAFLRDLGFSFGDGNYLDPLMVLEEMLPPTAVAAYGSSKFLELLQKRGYRLDFEHPDAVLIAIKEDFTNDEYAQMIELVLKGARLIGMHETSIYAKNGRRYPGVGAILKMISFATGADYDVVGKPSEPFFKKALQLLQRQDASITFADVEIVSDDLIGDLMGAKRLGMRTALVLSGKISSVDEVKPPLAKSADRVASDIAVLFNVRIGRTA
ncbi:HAD-IIA family hydrolase [Hydrogenimonas cancrithermarum]|uniref:Haloacid dehalogenase n=1 Tax=Hydrogenimonas cancrithermarum TaxID=2993563 RepID=A0ABN6WV32_9BACT|nr:HAD-IIA family hydrolase [Hydrogenimonas cancrithermarum]BDY12584.1 haloacid dehalogenase [Hydrogenimonas cancrithermarum]